MNEICFVVLNSQSPPSLGVTLNVNVNNAMCFKPEVEKLLTNQLETKTEYYLSPMQSGFYKQEINLIKLTSSLTLIMCYLGA